MSDVQDYLNALKTQFLSEGIIGGDLAPVLHAEKQYSEIAVATFHGFQVHVDVFFSYFLRTFDAVFKSIKQNRWPEGRPFFSVHLMLFAGSFKYFRAGQRVALHGYPIIAMGMLRDLVDRAFFLRAGLQDKERYELLFLTGPRGSIEERLAKSRIKLERTIINEVMTSSCISQDDIQCALSWRNMFHDEIHGAKLTLALDNSAWVRGDKAFAVAPDWDQSTYALYMNRFNEVAWLWLRLSCALQPAVGALGDVWEKEWTLLDESSKRQTDINKEFIASVRRFVASTFPYVPNTSFVV